MKSSKSKQISRRKFIGGAALSFAAFTIVPRSVLGGKGYTAPSDKLTMGFIGCGKQSGGLASRFMKLDDIQMVAACDIDSAKLEKFVKMANGIYSEKSGKEHKGLESYKMYEDLLARQDIDAVIIATPDHWHALPAIDALKAGKDVYCEKPLSHTLEEGRAMVDATRKYNKVFQTGSMQRSSYNFRQACELVQNGYIGEVTKVLANVGDPAVDCDLPAEKAPKELDWDRWLGPAQMREYNSIIAPPISFSGWPMWRNYKEFGGGILCDWGAHMFDIVQWGLGMDNTGPVEYIPPTDPKATRGLVMKYANGIEMVHEDFGRGWGVRFIGTEGTIDVSRKYLDSKSESIAKKEIGGNDKRLYFSDNHYQDFVDAVKSRKKPICDVEIGHRAASVCNIANIAYWLNKPLKWDPVKEKFDDKEANKLRGKKYRKPYSL
ncbi:Gfo/Idh/MocA family oxidoreductase [Flammeovirgaceae bacterium SG7u.111]|nr:Gfo/Idh/MocA family oxidoreductase [Flammeovirgaceae bacterium SG7u.132]WPO36430.1 Gfo/Idh/MocA family oxidoreductase [Flammeovirgaceae bacterium SG7u.111]